MKSDVRLYYAQQNAHYIKLRSDLVESLSQREFHLYCVMLCLANENGEVREKVCDLANYTCLSDKQVYNTIKRLKEKNCVKSVRDVWGLRLVVCEYSELLAEKAEH